MVGASLLERGQSLQILEFPDLQIKNCNVINEEYQVETSEMKTNK